MPSSKRTLFGKNPSPTKMGGAPPPVKRKPPATAPPITAHPQMGEAPKQATDKKRASVIKQTKTPRKPLAAARAAVIGGQQQRHP